MKRSRSFPTNFMWGSATAAYQIEGAATEDGRGPSIWDTYSHTPGRVLNGDTGDVADDHYHRWKEDVEHMKKLGLGAYRFSISWPRVQPDGQGDFNERGIQFYKSLVEALIEAGIAPIVTLYHWDLPQALEDKGGWTNRETAFHFERYAQKMAHELGTSVDTWTTFNEPWCSAYLGYASGVHAPGHTNPESALKAVHHLNLAHGLAGRAIRAELGQDTKISITLNLHVVRAQNPEDPADSDALRRVDGVGNRVFLEPLLEGHYPADVIEDTKNITDWSFIERDDEKIINLPLSILGVNYYSTNLIRALKATDNVEEASDNDGHGNSSHTPWVGCDDVMWLPLEGPYTDMGWNIEPAGLSELLECLHFSYPNQPLMITENGAAFPDVVEDGRIHDIERVAYLHDHISAMAESIEKGVDVQGYFAWSLLDNFEWAWGYSRRFGIIRVDYDTQVRTWKDSAYWYRKLACTSVVPSIEEIEYF